MTHFSTSPARMPASLLTAGGPAAPWPRLDLAVLRSGVAWRRNRLLSLEAAMVAACERAAARGRAGGVCIDDRATWDRATWRRYLDAATRLEPAYGPPMRRLLQEIDQLKRLMALPRAA